MRPLVLDGLLALLLAGDVLASLLPGVPVAAIALLLAGTLSISFRRFAPEAVLALTSTAFSVCVALRYLYPPLPFAPLVAIYTVAVHRRPSISLTTGGAAAIGVIAGSVFGQRGINDDTFLEYLPSLVAAVTIGYSVRIGRARATLLEERSIQLVVCLVIG